MIYDDDLNWSILLVAVDSTGTFISIGTVGMGIDQIFNIDYQLILIDNISIYKPNKVFFQTHLLWVIALLG